jgi:hypothetical protein
MVRTGPQKFPGASTAYWYGDRYAGAAMEVNVAVWHTTEGTSVPTYGGGAAAPTLTALPDFGAKRLRWYQHFDIDQSARALVDRAGGITTNRNNAVQIELVGTCDPATHRRWAAAGRQHVFWPEAPDWALREVARFVRWLHDQHRVPMTSTVTWRAYPGSYGTAAPQRLSSTAFNAYTGHLGHQHVPEGNDHGDPGNLDMAKILAYAKGETPEEDDPMAGMTPKDIATAAWLTDGVVGVPEDWSPGNKEWMPASILIDIGKRTRGLEKQLTALTDANRKLVETVGQLAGQMGDLDPAAIVAELSQALESIQLRIDVPDQA